MHFSLVMMIPMTIGAVGGVLARRLFLYMMQLNADRQAKVLIEARNERINNQRKARSLYTMNDEFSYSDHHEEVLRG